jgi:hypothetical protein
MFEIYCSARDANRNDLVDRLLNGASLETSDGRFDWVSGVMPHEILALAGFVIAASGNVPPQAEVEYGLLCRAVAAPLLAQRAELADVSALIAAFEDDYAQIGA